MQMTGTFYRLLLSSALFAVVIAAPARAQELVTMYSFTELQSDSGGATRAYALNNTAQVIGWADVEGNRHSAHWSNEVFTDLQDIVHFDLQHPFRLFNLGISESFDISNADQVVGTGRTEIDCPPKVVITNAFILRPAVLTDLATPYPGDAVTNLGTLAFPCSGGLDSAATGISNRNHVVGWAARADGAIRAFLVAPVAGEFYRDDEASDPNHPGYLVNDLMIDLGTFRDDTDPVSSAAAVNDWGQVTGYAYTLATPAGTAAPLPKAAYRAFVVTPGPDADGDGVPEWFEADPATGGNALMAQVGTLGGYNSWGRDINNAGQVVGESDTDPDDTGGNHLTRAFVVTPETQADGTQIWYRDNDGDGANDLMVDLGTLAHRDPNSLDDPNNANSAASAINDNGDVVGWSENAAGQRRAFLVQPEVQADGTRTYFRDEDNDGANDLMIDLNDRLLLLNERGLNQVASIILTEARDVNDDGVICGWGTVRGSSSQETRGFLLTDPVLVDPSTLVDDEGTGGAGANGGGDGSAFTGSPIIGTPGNLTTTGTTTGGATTTQEPQPAAVGLCGFGTFAILPLTLAGLCWMKVGVPSRLRRKG